MKSFPFPENVCLSTLRRTTGSFYSRGAIDQLWVGRQVSPFLDFDLPEFHQYRRENANRISISGVQDKLSARVIKGHLIPSEERGEYIIKPIPSTLGLDFQDQVPANEHFTMQLAGQVAGIQVPANGLVFFPNGDPAYVVKRFDLDFESGAKLPQEDFCQLSQRSSASHGANYKYDSSYEELARLLKKFCPSYAIEVEKLFRLIVFNYLVGNGDAHLKNFSITPTSLGDFVLSPAYDLLNTSLHLPADSRMALDLFADDYESEAFLRAGFHTGDDFRELARRFGMQKTRTEKMLEQFLGKQEPAEALLMKSMLSDDAKSRYQSVLADRFRALAF